MKEGKNLDDIQSVNRALIIKYLSEVQECSRAELAKMSGLKQASITKIVRALMESGIVKETGITEGKKGRRSIGLALNGERYKVIGVKLSRKTVVTAVYDITGKKYDELFEKLTLTDGVEKAMDMIQKHIIVLREKHPNVLAVGLAVPGPYFKQEGKIRLVTELAGWKEIDVKSSFLDVDIPVYIEHDAHAGAFVCWSKDEEKSENQVIVHFLASEGIGSGAVINGNVFNGSQGIAGEVGHVSIDYDGIACECGNQGCLIKYCSSISMERIVEDEVKNHPDSVLYGKNNITAKEIFDAMEKGDEFCISVVERVGTYMGYGLQILVNMYNPDKIIISDIMSRGGDIMMKKINDVLKKRLLPQIYSKLIVDYADTKDDVILYGAALIAIDKVTSKPNKFLIGIPNE